MNDSATNVLQSIPAKYLNTFMSDLELNEQLFPFVTKKYWNDKKGNIVEFELNISRYEAEETYLLVAFKQNLTSETHPIPAEKSDLIRKKLGLFEVFINQIKEGVFVFDADGKLVYKNGAAEKLVKISDADLKKRLFGRFLNISKTALFGKKLCKKLTRKKTFASPKKSRENT